MCCDTWSLWTACLHRHNQRRKERGRGLRGGAWVVSGTDGSLAETVANFEAERNFISRQIRHSFHHLAEIRTCPEDAPDERIGIAPDSAPLALPTGPEQAGHSGPSFKRCAEVAVQVVAELAGQTRRLGPRRLGFCWILGGLCQGHPRTQSPTLAVRPTPCVRCFPREAMCPRDRAEPASDAATARAADAE